MVRSDPARDEHLTTRGQVAARGLEEEEGLLGDRVVELLDVVGVVAPNGDNLHRQGGQHSH